jgi:hypothetical protein
MSRLMNNIDDILVVLEESRELARRLELLQQRIGCVGAPELADIGGTVTMFMSPAAGTPAPRAGPAPSAGEGCSAG